MEGDDDLVALPDTVDLDPEQLEVFEEIGRGSFGKNKTATFQLRCFPFFLHILIFFFYYIFPPPFPMSLLGIVSRGRYAGSIVAVKRIHSGLDRRGEFAHEVSMLKAMKHPNIVLFMGVVHSKGEGETPGDLYLVQEFVQGGSLRSVLDDRSRFLDWETRIRLFLSFYDPSFY